MPSAACSYQDPQLSAILSMGALASLAVVNNNTSLLAAHDNPKPVTGALCGGINQLIQPVHPAVFPTPNTFLTYI